MNRGNGGAGQAQAWQELAERQGEGGAEDRVDHGPLTGAERRRGMGDPEGSRLICVHALHILPSVLTPRAAL